MTGLATTLWALAWLGLHRRVRAVLHVYRRDGWRWELRLPDGTRIPGTGEDSPACKLAGLRAAVERRVSMERVAVVDLPPSEVDHA